MPTYQIEYLELETITIRDLSKAQLDAIAYAERQLADLQTCPLGESK